jgi:hypothetical protein
LPEIIKSEGAGNVRLKESTGDIRTNCYADYVIQTLISGRWENAIALNTTLMPFDPAAIWGKYIHETPVLINVQGIGTIRVLYIPSYSAFYK